MYIEVRVQWTKSQNSFTIINCDQNWNNNNVNNTNIYCYINNIVLTLFLNTSKFDVLKCSFYFIHSHGTAYMNKRSRKVCDI